MARDVGITFPVHVTFKMLVTLGTALVYVMGEGRPESNLLRFLKCSSNSFATRLQLPQKIERYCNPIDCLKLGYLTMYLDIQNETSLVAFLFLLTYSSYGNLGTSIYAPESKCTHADFQV